MKEKIDNLMPMIVVVLAIAWGYTSWSGTSHTASANEPQQQVQRFVPSGEQGLALDTKTGQLCNSMQTADTFPLCSDLAKK